MIYTEQIGNDAFDVYITRQNDDVQPNWYSTCLTWTDMDGNEMHADNDRWIFKTLLPLTEKKEWSAAGKELNVAWDKKAHKQLREVLREAYALGWYNEEQ